VVADAVWDEAMGGHAIAGSTGATLSGRAAAGDAMALTSAERNAIADAHFARPLPASPAGDTAGEALRAAAAQGIGDWDITGDVLTLKDPAGVALAQFDLTPAGGPYTARVRQ
jgi:hypothetical protein